MVSKDDLPPDKPLPKNQEGYVLSANVELVGNSVLQTKQRLVVIGV